MGCNQSHLIPQSSLITVEQNNIIVKDMWADICVNHYEEVGINFMVRLLQDHQHLKRLWIFAANLETEEEIRTNSQVRYHATKIMNTLKEIITNIDNNDKRQHILERLGKIHYTYDVKSSYLEVAKPTMEFALRSALGNKFTRRRKEAWSVFFEGIIVDLSRGVEHQALLEANSKPKSNVDKNPPV